MPLLVAYRGRIVALDDCVVEQGRCYAFCPRTATDLDAASEAAFGAAYDDGPIGRVAEVLMARAARSDVRERRNMRTVSALVAFAIERGLIDSAVVTKSEASLLPSGVLVRDASEVISHAGSNYVAAPTLAAFNREAQREDVRRVGVVATPCQALALAKMRSLGAGEPQPYRAYRQAGRAVAGGRPVLHVGARLQRLRRLTRRKGRRWDASPGWISRRRRLTSCRSSPATRSSRFRETRCAASSVPLATFAGT